VLGVFWSLLEPLLMMGVMYLIFSHLFKSTIENYPLFLLLGIILWNFFSRSTSMGLGSIVQRAGILNQIYFPRAILPVSATITAFMMMGLEFAVFFGFVIAFQFSPPVTILFLPILIGLMFVLSLGVSLILSVFFVKYKDLQSIWSIVLYAGFFLTPVIYELDIFPKEIKEYLLINPLAHILDMAHSTTLTGNMPLLYSLGYVTMFSFGVLIVGFFVFKHYEFKVIEEV